MTEFLSALVASVMALVTPTDSYLGDCTRYKLPSGAQKTECYYTKTDDPGPLHDELRATAGKFLMSGPWATDQDIDYIALPALARGRAVILNVGLRGIGIVVNNQSGTFMSNVSIDVGAPVAAIHTPGGSINLQDVNLRWRRDD